MATRFSVPLVHQQSRGIFLYSVPKQLRQHTAKASVRVPGLYGHVMCVAGCRFRPMTFKGRGAGDPSFLLIATWMTDES